MHNNQSHTKKKKKKKKEEKQQQQQSKQAILSRNVWIKFQNESDYPIEI
jgi:hypothetical protein